MLAQYPIRSPSPVSLPPGMLTASPPANQLHAGWRDHHSTGRLRREGLGNPCATQAGRQPPPGPLTVLFPPPFLCAEAPTSPALPNASRLSHSPLVCQCTLFLLLSNTLCLSVLVDQMALISKSSVSCGQATEISNTQRIHTGHAVQLQK
jgi:hypothetical protein